MSTANKFGAEIPGQILRVDEDNWRSSSWEPQVLFVLRDCLVTYFNRQTKRIGIYVVSRTISCRQSTHNDLEGNPHSADISRFWLLESPPCIPIFVWCCESYILGHVWMSLGCSPICADDVAPFLHKITDRRPIHGLTVKSSLQKTVV